MSLNHLVLLATLLLLSDGLAVMPLVIVAVAITYVLVARLAPMPAPSPPAPPAASGPGEETVSASRS